jgi:hypothetical protein
MKPLTKPYFYVYVGRWKVFFNVFNVSSRGEPFVMWDFGTEGNIQRVSLFPPPTR